MLATRRAATRGLDDREHREAVGELDRELGVSRQPHGLGGGDVGLAPVAGAVLELGVDLERGRERADVADPRRVVEQRVEQAAGEVVVLDPQQRLRHVVAARQLPLALEPGRRLAQQRRALARLAAQDEHGAERLADRAGRRLGHARRRAAAARRALASAEPVSPAATAVPAASESAYAPRSGSRSMTSSAIAA